jgi:hypothetical protein
MAQALNSHATLAIRGRTFGPNRSVAPVTSRIPKTGDLLLVWNNAPDKRTSLNTGASISPMPTAVFSTMAIGPFCISAQSMKIAAMKVAWLWQ